MSKEKSTITNILVIIASIFFCLLLVDFVVFFLSPTQGITFFSAYKKDQFQERLNAAVHYFPRGYNVADPIMGFDIQKNFPSISANLADQPFQIFSNEIGCFDHHSLAEIKAAKSYDYFAGDSFAWGYGHYEQNIPSTYEKLSGRFTVKCGIIHSGQKHQFEKFQRTEKLIGHPPKRVILTFYENDVANDYAYPHTTVIDGYEVDTYRFDGDKFQLVPRNMNQIRVDIQAGLNPKSQNWISRLDAWLNGHSITWNLLKVGVKQTKTKELATVYGISEAVNYGKDRGYETAEVTKKNREGLDLWINDAKQNHYELIMLLIPPKIHHANTHFYGGLRQYLESKNIRYYDLTEPFYASKKRSEELYWLNDGHLGNDGNIFVGKFLADKLK
jgi:hypothetical protein